MTVRTELVDLWPEVDRIALCIHHPSSRDPRLRAAIDGLGLPPASILVNAARFLAGGRVTTDDVRLLNRYESRALVDANVERHAATGFLLVTDAPGAFAAAPHLRDAAHLVLEVQAAAAAALWRAHVPEVAELAGLADRVMAAIRRPVPTPAFDAQLALHEVAARDAPSSVVARMTELRSLRADLHADALLAEGLAGPRARSLDRAWKGHPLTDADVERLARAGLVEVDGTGGWRVTGDALDRRARAQQATEERSAAALAGAGEDDTTRLLALLRSLPGEDPRPLEDR